MSGTRDTRTIGKAKESLQWGFPSIITFCLQVYILLEETITNIGSSLVKRGSVAGIVSFVLPIPILFGSIFSCTLTTSANKSKKEIWLTCSVSIKANPLSRQGKTS